VRGERRIERVHSGGHLLPHSGMVVATVDEEVVPEQVADRQPGRRLAV
jgi:hypothetical protein